MTANAPSLFSMNEVQLHSKRLAGHGVLARGVKMKGLFCMVWV